MQFPKLKKKVNAFLLGEEGKISKNSILCVGSFLAGAAAMMALEAQEAAAQSHGSNYAHVNGLDFQENSGALMNSHDHHYNHTSHTSHASHASHGSHSSW
jgi:hypothetical protein